MLKYTGHPMVDVGTAAIVSFTGKQDPSEITPEDLERVSEYMLHHYNRAYLNSFLSCIFMNSAYYQKLVAEAIARKTGRPIALDPVKQKEYHDLHLFAYRRQPDNDAPRCGICGDLSVGMANREHFPLLTGRDDINFFANGGTGLQVCAACMIGVAMFPLGALRCGGRALFVHADDAELTRFYAERHLRHNRSLLQLEGLADDAKFPDAKQPKTRLIETLREWARDEKRREGAALRGEESPTSLTAYHLTNSGQGPDLDMYHLASPVIGFVKSAEGERYRSAWHAVIAAAWRSGDENGPETARKNFLYEDLLRLPDGWERFVRTYFLRRAFHAPIKDDPRKQYATIRERDLIVWPLTELFLRRIPAMETHRIETIRSFGDRVADYIVRDPGFWNHINLAKSYRGLRARIVIASWNEQKAGRPPLIGFDEFITVFEYGEESPRPDWHLARDLVLIRVIEQLHQRRWFEKQADLVDPEIDVPIETDRPESSSPDGAAVLS